MIWSCRCYYLLLLLYFGKSGDEDKFSLEILGQEMKISIGIGWDFCRISWVIG